MIELIRKVNILLTRRQRRVLMVVGLMLIIRAGVELLGIASIMPFMGIVADPSTIHENPYLARAFSYFGFEDDAPFIVTFGVAVVVFLLLANTFSALTVYVTTRFSWGLHHSVSTRLLAAYLRQPYGFFVQRNSAALGKSVLSESQQLVQSLVLPLLTSAAKITTITAITVLLVVMEPLLAVGVVALLGGAYGAIYLSVRGHQRRIGKVRLEANEARFKVVNEAFGGIKDVKVLQREKSFVRAFQPASRRYSTSIALNAAIAQLPRYLFEVLAFGGIILIVVYFIRTGHGLAQILPMLSLYAFAGYRLMPELQQLFQAVTQIRFTRPALDSVVDDFRSVVNERAAGSARHANLDFSSEIVFRDVIFSYPDAASPAIKGANFAIPRNHTIGLVGASGSGKTTLIDLLLGLFPPTSGQILVDGTPLDDSNRASWLAQVGYVPQHIFLVDDDIASNIAFGIPEAERDHDRIIIAARTANLDEFIESLPDGYRTIVGERGVRLSGGQRQRIGIARALYHNPNVLIMDEATSALDGATESAVMHAIRALSGYKTIILIAHRLTTVRSADTILLIENGRVLATGDYEELIKSSRQFRELANITGDLGE